MAIVDRCAKAILASLIATLGALSAVLVGDTSVGAVTAGQWVSIGLAGLVALGVTYGVPNAAPPIPPKA